MLSSQKRVPYHSFSEFCWFWNSPYGICYAKNISESMKMPDLNGAWLRRVFRRKMPENSTIGLGSGGERRPYIF